MDLVRLEHDEVVVWRGRPLPGARLAEIERPVWLVELFGLAVVAAVVGVLVIGGGPGPGRPPSPQRFGLAICRGLVLIPAAIVVPTAPLRARRRAGRTRYLLTNRRAILCEPGPFGRRIVESFPFDKMKDRVVRERDDKSGDLAIATRPSWIRGAEVPVGFLAIAEVRKVESLLVRMCDPDA